MSDTNPCWLCGTTDDIVYVDVLGLAWCQKDYAEGYDA